MFFLLRTAFWLTIVLALLPTGSGRSQPETAQVGPADAVMAAGVAVSDMSNFCERQPEACKIGSQTASAIGQRAQAGAQMVYEFINDRVVRDGVSDGKASDGKLIPASLANQPDSQNTLRSSDLAPGWRGPLPRKDPRKEGRHGV